MANEVKGSKQQGGGKLAMIGCGLKAAPEVLARALLETS